jgi:hypothetical protein
MDDVLKLLKLQSDLITGAPAKFPVTVEDSSMLPNGVKIEQITIYPLKVGTVMRISPLCREIPEKDLEKLSASKDVAFHPEAPALMEKYSGVIVKIICHGIHNKKGKYPGYMERFLQMNFTFQDLHVLLNAVLFRMGTISFTDSTIATQKMGLESMEIIAMQQNLKTWSVN